MKIVDFIREELILPDVRATRKAEAIEELAAHLAEHHAGIDARDVARVLREREQRGATTVGEGLAVPHGKLRTAGQLIASLARSRKGLDFGAEDGRPTHFLFVLLAPPQAAGDHLKALARISRLFRSAEFRKRLLAAESAAEMYRIIQEEDASSQ